MVSAFLKAGRFRLWKKEEEFEHEILSVFYDEEYFGFVLKSDKAEHKYMMQLYNQSGEKVMSKYFDLAYDQVKLEEDNLILFNESTFEIYGTGGRKKFSGKYKKPIVDVISIKGFLNIWFSPRKVQM